MTRRLLVMAGGTGGHVFPGLAVAQMLQDRGWQVHWLGTRDKMEADLVPQYQIPIHFIDIAGVRGNGLKAMLLAPFKIVWAILQALKICKSVQPHVVLGMGGYASGPGGIAAWLLNKPLVLHEQNAVPGVTNRMLAPLARKVLTAFDNADWSVSGDKLSQVGNPVRAAFAQIAPLQEIERPVRILVSGGSLGAKALNDEIPVLLAQLKNHAFEVRHQAGKNKSDEVVSAYEASGISSSNWQVHEFLDDIVEDYAWADLVICRAGALTVSEVAIAGRCAVFVPLPYAVDDHQTKNAMSLVEHEAGFCVQQHEFAAGKLKQIIEMLLIEPKKIVAVANKARALGERTATERVSNICESEAIAT
ncbi:MAG: undecaprenyldiphospho-muramoylpentapeptide beta-N-acetylglucosaminyltransferase [Aestuariibacter sp.]